LSAAAAPIRVLVCEDSRVYSVALRRTLEHEGDIVVAAVCPNAEQALAMLPGVEPDLVTMDIELPGMTGLEAVEHIMASRPTPILVLSSHVGEEGSAAAAALAAGALEALAKDDIDLTRPGGAAAAAFRRRVRTLARARVIRHPRARLKQARTRAAARPRQVAAAGVVASTGGPQALATVLGGLPPDYPVPVLVVQHIAAGFIDGLVRWLDGAIDLSARLAEDGAQLAPGITVAPEGVHLRVGPDGRLVLDRRGNGGLHRPSGDVLLASLAESLGADAAAVVLTGMGRDGAVGAAKVHAAGGLVIAQDEESSAVFGMPKAAAELGVDAVGSPEEIAALLSSLEPVGERRR